MSAALRSSPEIRGLEQRPPSVIDARIEAGLKNLIRFASGPDEKVSPFPQSDWNPLIEQLRTAGQHVRAVGIRAHEQDAHVQQLMEHMREEICKANERANTAEALVRDIKTQAEAQLMLAEKHIATATVRADAAEARAQTAEQWLAHAQETIIAEFSELLA